MLQIVINWNIPWVIFILLLQSFKISLLAWLWKFSRVRKACFRPCNVIWQFDTITFWSIIRVDETPFGKTIYSTTKLWVPIPNPLYIQYRWSFMLSRIKEIHARYHGEAQADLIMDGKGYKLWTRVNKGYVPALQYGMKRTSIQSLNVNYTWRKEYILIF